MGLQGRWQADDDIENLAYNYEGLNFDSLNKDNKDNSNLAEYKKNIGRAEICIKSQKYEKSLKFLLEA